MGSVRVPSESPADNGNRLLEETPAQLMTGLVQTPKGQRLYVTIRTNSTTLTVFLTGAGAKVWAEQFAKEAAAIPGAGLIAANGALKGKAVGGGRDN
jgi:hypothetical protein